MTFFTRLAILGLAVTTLGGGLWGLTGQIKQDRANRQIAALTDSTAYYRQKWEFCKASTDTIHGIGQYHVDTVKIVRNAPAVPVEPQTPLKDTMPQTPQNCVTFDTTKYFGAGSNPFGVRVAGKFYFNPELKPNNWLLINPLGYAMPIPLPTKPENNLAFLAGVGYYRSMFLSLGTERPLSQRWAGQIEGMAGKDFGGKVTIAIRF